MSHLFSPGRLSRTTILALIFALAPGYPRWCHAVDAERTAASLMPAEAVAYVELTNTRQLLVHAVDGEFGKRILEVPPLKKAMYSKQAMGGRLVLSLVEIGLETTWRQALEDLTAGGVYASVNPGGESVLLINSRSGEWLDKFRTKLMDLARGQAKREGKPDPFHEESYRDLLVIRANNAWLGYVGDWLVVCQKKAACHAVLDRFLDGAEQSLATNPRFQAAQGNKKMDDLAWGFVDVEKIRGSGDQAELKFTDNILAEILFGGILDVVRNTPFATSHVGISGRKLTWSVESPYDTQWPGENRTHFFGEKSAGQAPPRLAVDRHLATIAAHRDISQAWLRSGDLMTDKAVDDLAQADATLAVFFAGRDFGEDILSTLKPDVQLIIARQDFTEAEYQPTIKLPAFALVSNLRDPTEMKPQLRRLFVSFVGFLNFVGATEGNMQLDFDMKETEQMTLLTSKFVPIKGKDDQRKKEAPIQFNFTPAVAFHGERFVISSSSAFARELATATPVAGAIQANTAVAANGTEIGKILLENRESLISQNMLEDGHTRQEAEQQIDAILAVANVIQRADLRLTPSESEIGIRLEVELAPLNSEQN